MMLVTLAGGVLTVLIVATCGHDSVRQGVSGTFLLIWGLGQDLCLGLQYVFRSAGAISLGTVIYEVLVSVVQFAISLLSLVSSPLMWVFQKLLEIEAMLFSDRTPEVNYDAAPVLPDTELSKLQCSGMAAEKRCQRRSTAGSKAPWFCKQHERQAIYFLTSRTVAPMGNGDL